MKEQHDGIKTGTLFSLQSNSSIGFPIMGLGRGRVSIIEKIISKNIQIIYSNYFMINDLLFLLFF